MGKNKPLNDVSLDAKSGEMIALIGDSDGKSSLMNLLMRFYDPSEGEICINGTNLKEFGLHDVRNNIAMVTQRVYIFP